MPNERTERPENLVKAELLLGLILRYGVLVCGSIIAFGVVMSFVRPVPGDDAARVLRGEMLPSSPVPHSIGEFARAVTGLQSEGIIALGLLLLVGLPIFRVAFTVVLFLFEKDYLYLLITSIVLAVLLSGLILGKSL